MRGRPSAVFAEASLEGVGVAGEGILALEDPEPARIVAEREQGRALRSPLTAGSIARIQFTSHAHITVVTSSAS